jgi:dextranase
VLGDLKVRIQVDRPVARVWWASPDVDDLSAHILAVSSTVNHIAFRIPRLAYWDLIVVEYRP